MLSEIIDVVIIGGVGVAAYYVYEAVGNPFKTATNAVDNVFSFLNKPLVSIPLPFKVRRPADGGYARSSVQADKNKKGIGFNRALIFKNTADIQTNRDLIDTNTAAIQTNSAKIDDLDQELDDLDTRVGEDEEKIQANTLDIAANAVAAAKAQETADANTVAIGIVTQTVNELGEDVNSRFEDVTQTVNELSEDVNSRFEDVNSRVDGDEQKIAANARATHVGLLKERQKLIEEITEVNQRAASDFKATTDRLTNLESRRLSYQYDKIRYEALVANNSDALMATFPTYVECETGYPVHGLSSDGATVILNNSDGSDARVSVEERVQDCLALQKYMDTDPADNQFFWWRNVSPAAWDDVKKTAHAVAESNAEFGWAGHIDAKLVQKFNEKAASYTNNDSRQRFQVGRQRPFIEEPASKVLKFGQLDSWLRKGPTFYERMSGYAYHPPTPPDCGPTTAAGDGSYSDCDTGDVAWLPGTKPDWAH